MNLDYNNRPEADNTLRCILRSTTKIKTIIKDKGCDVTK